MQVTKNKPFERIDFFLPHKSQYEVLHHFTQEFYKTFVSLGFTCRLLEPTEINTICLEDPPDVTFCFNGAPMASQGVLLADAIGKPHISWLVDLPYHYWFLINSPNIFIAYDDEVSGFLLKKHNHKKNFFLPQAASVEVSIEKSAPRDIPVLCLASYFDYEEERVRWWDLPPLFVNILEEAATRAFNETDTSFVTIFFEIWQRYEKEGGEPLLPLKSQFDLLKRLERYLKGKARAMALRSMPEGVVVAYDERWISYLARHRPDIKVMPSIPYVEALQLMARSKIVLSNSIRSPLGGSERVIEAMAHKAVALTNDNPFMRNHFTDGENILLYSLSEKEKIAERVNTILQDDNLFHHLAENGYEAVKAAHTWEQRALTLLQQVEVLSQ